MTMASLLFVFIS